MIWGYPTSETSILLGKCNGCFDEGVGAVDNWVGEVILNMAIEKLMI
jgi:hypothetical protein